MPNAFADHFSEVAAEYARFRPGYPPALFEWLASMSPGRQRALDVATGNGQAALGLAGHFELTVAADASAEQLRAATPHRQVCYVRARAESLPVASASLDLITVAQAAHWLDRSAFFAEATRALRPAGVIAVWCYELARVDPRIDPAIERFTRQTVGPWWAADRRLVENGYRDLDFPFDELPPPAMAMKRRWTLDEFLGYVGTWSAVRNYRKGTGSDPIPRFREQLAPVWGAATRRVEWPLGVRVGRPSEPAA